MYICRICNVALTEEQVQGSSWRKPALCSKGHSTINDNRKAGFFRGLGYSLVILLGFGMVSVVVLESSPILSRVMSLVAFGLVLLLMIFGLIEAKRFSRLQLPSSRLAGASYATVTGMLSVLVLSSPLCLHTIRVKTQRLGPLWLPSHLYRLKNYPKN